MDRDIIEAKVWIICSCGQKHLLVAGIDTPVYWCGNELLKLKTGDDLEYELVGEE